MRHWICGLLIVAAVAFTASAPAQVSAVDAESSDIVVKGIRDRDRQIANFIDTLADAPVGGQLARFEEAACPAAIGLAPGQNVAVAARMRSVAKAAGIPVGKEGCRPNVFVVVAQDKKAMVRTIREKWTDPRGDRVRIPEQSGPAVALHLEGLLDANGIRAGTKQEEGDGRSSYYTVEMAHGSSRLSPASRPHFLATALVVEPAALAGLTTTQLADYAAMRLLARTDPSRLEKLVAPTILTILDAPMGSAVPLTLTQWDFGFLKALYGSAENRYANQQRTEMRQLLSKELAKPVKEGEE